MILENMVIAAEVPPVIVNTVDSGDDRLLAPEFNSHVHAFVSAVGNNVYPTAYRTPEM